MRMTAQKYSGIVLEKISQAAQQSIPGWRDI